MGPLPHMPTLGQLIPSSIFKMRKLEARKRTYLSGWTQPASDGTRN